MTTNPILVTGGTGTLGKEVVPLLRAAGHRVRVLSRNPKPATDGVEHVACDLMAGTGIDEAVAGVDTVLHLAGGPKGDEVATRNLVAAAQRAGVKHLVYISVVAADRIPLAYYRAKAASERIVENSGIPYTTLRATQFHTFVLAFVEKAAKLPVVLAPGGMRCEPVDVHHVAERLVELTLGEPAGLVADLVGPRVYTLGEVTAGYLAAQGRRRPQLPIRVPGKVGRAYRAGDNLAGAGAERGGRGWEAFLGERVGAA